jgi:DNA-binding transcriptional ArsR family regulator
MTNTPAKRAGQGSKTIEELTTYTVNNPIRVQIIVLLREGRNYTHSEIAEILGQPMNKVGNHLRELVEAASIEVAEVRRSRNTVTHVYRAVESSFNSEEDIAAMPPYQRQFEYGLVIQHLVAEIMASFRAGKLHEDPQSWIVSNWLNLDARGRQDLADEQERAWERLEEIEAESLNRVAVSGEETASYVVGQVSFERARKAPRPPRSADGD